MSDIRPYDIKVSQSIAAVNAIRPFNCILLMPFEARFDQVAKVIHDTVSKRLEEFAASFGPEPPRIERLDWVTSAGVIQREIWEKINEADLIFCDIIGYNPNVMFETGVAAAWKKIWQVVFIKDRFFKQQSAFDIEPLRYTEYELTSDGLQRFRDKITQLTTNALIAFPIDK